MARDFANKLYKSSAWKKLRGLVFNEANGACEKCGESGEEVHHIIWLTPKNINDIDIALGRDNLILLCRNCHMNIHRKKEVTKEGLKFNSNGELVPIK